MIHCAYLVCALQCQRSGARRQLVLLCEGESQPGDGGVRHDCGGDWPCGLRRGEQPAPAPHEGEEGLESRLHRAGHQPAHDLPPPPVDRAEGEPRHLQAQLEGGLQQGRGRGRRRRRVRADGKSGGGVRRLCRLALGEGVPEGVLGKLEEVGGGADVALGDLQDGLKTVNVA